MFSINILEPCRTYLGAMKLVANVKLSVQKWNIISDQTSLLLIKKIWANAVFRKQAGLQKMPLLIFQ